MPADPTPEISQEAARAMLAALVHLTSAFPDPIKKPQQRLRYREAAILNGSIIAAQNAIALAEGRAS
jgi:hypothetical protein